MKMKKIVCAMVSAALLVSMAAATAFAVESVPSKTGTDADAGKTDVSVSGSASSEACMWKSRPRRIPIRKRPS